MKEEIFNKFINFLNSKEIVFDPGNYEDSALIKSNLTDELFLISAPREYYSNFKEMSLVMIFDKKNQKIYADSAYKNIEFNKLNTSNITIVNLPIGEYLTQARKTLEDYVIKNYDELKKKARGLDPETKETCTKLAKKQYIRGNLIPHHFYREDDDFYCDAAKLISYVYNPEKTMQEVLEKVLKYYDEYTLGFTILQNEFEEEIYNSLLADPTNKYFKNRGLYKAITSASSSAKTFKLVLENGCWTQMSREELLDDVLQVTYIDNKGGEFENVKALIYKGKTLIEFSD